MIISVHQPQYIPWLGYFDKIAKSGAFVFLDRVQYKAREFQNRNKIRTKDGAMWLTVPVVSKGLGLQDISDVAIDNTFVWRRQHLLGIKTSYGRSDHFDRYFPFFEDLYKKEWNKLIDLNIAVVLWTLKELEIKTPLYYESKLRTGGKKTGRIIEICGKLNADKYLSGAGGKDYLDEDSLAKAGVGLLYQDFKHPVYRQQFMKSDKDFIRHLSILDLLFNEGPGSRKILGLE
jgi:hypothetical protein